MINRTGSLVGGAILAVLTACQPEAPPALSLEEAKKVTKTFEGQAFTPPPRKIEDVRILLQAASDGNRAELMELRARADAAAPTGSTPEERAESLRARASAAGEIGRLKQMIADLKSAQDQGLSASRLLSELSSLLAHAEMENGNLRAIVA